MGWRKMSFGDIKWYGAWGSAIAAMLFLRMTLDHTGWKLALDLAFAAWWIGLCVRFIMLTTVVIEKPVGSITVNGEEIWP